MSEYRRAVDRLCDRFEADLQLDLAEAVTDDELNQALERHATRWDQVFDGLVALAKCQNAAAERRMREVLAPIRAQLEKRVADMTWPQ